MRYQDLRTASGYPLDEVTSALQKEIRRGNPMEAGYWALELQRSGYWKHLWKRLTIIASEDIGDPDIVVLVGALREGFAFCEKASKTTMHWILAAHAVLAMCEVEKTRKVDHFAYLLQMRYEEDWRLEVPDYAVDMHTTRGKRLGRDIGHFFQEGAKIHPLRAGVDDPYEEPCLEKAPEYERRRPRRTITRDAQPGLFRDRQGD